MVRPGWARKLRGQLYQGYLFRDGGEVLTGDPFAVVETESGEETTFPAPLEVTDNLTLWWTEGAQVKVQVNSLAQEVTPQQARAMANWCLAYANEAQKEKGPAAGR